MVTGGRRRVAVLGGGRAARRHARRLRTPGVTVRVYRSSREGGRGEARRLCESLRRGGVDAVVVVQSFNGHSASGAVRALCAQLSVPCRLVERAAELPGVLRGWCDAGRGQSRDHEGAPGAVAPERRRPPR